MSRIGMSRPLAHIHTALPPPPPAPPPAALAGSLPLPQHHPPGGGAAAQDPEALLLRGTPACASHPPSAMSPEKSLRFPRSLHPRLGTWSPGARAPQRGGRFRGCELREPRPGGPSAFPLHPPPLPSPAPADPALGEGCRQAPGELSSGPGSGPSAGPRWALVSSAENEGLDQTSPVAPGGPERTRVNQTEPQAGSERRPREDPRLKAS